LVTLSIQSSTVTRAIPAPETWNHLGSRAQIGWSGVFVNG
jgi:hypothetical protein